jgi:hypothetical protein
VRTREGEEEERYKRAGVKEGRRRKRRMREGG